MTWRFVVGVGVSAAVGSIALADSPSTDEVIDLLTEQVAELKAEVEILKARNSDDWLTEQRATEIRGLVEDVLADADMRASLLQGGGTAGWDKNFFLQSADGNWKLRIRGQIQLRFVWNHASNQANAMPVGPDELYGFEVRRAKLKFDGHVLDPSWRYTLNLALDHDSSDNEFDVEDAFFRKSFDNGVTIWGGQHKLEFNREELTSSSYQLAVDRSEVNELFNLDRSQGVMVEYAGDKFRLWGGYSNGAAQRAVGFDSQNVLDADAFTGRVDWLAAGDWTQFKDFQGWKGQDFAAMVGGAIHYQVSRYGADVNTAMTPRTTRVSWTIDGQIEGDGWSAFAYIVGNHLSDNAAGSTSASQLGFVVQGAWMLNDKWDIYARYEWADLDDNSSMNIVATSPGLTDLSIITVGVNYYIDNHTAKWTSDIGFGLDSTPDTTSNSAVRGVGWRPDAPGEDGQVVFRTQLQLLF